MQGLERRRLRDVPRDCTLGSGFRAALGLPGPSRFRAAAKSEVNVALDPQEQSVETPPTALATEYELRDSSEDASVLGLAQAQEPGVAS